MNVLPNNGSAVKSIYRSGKVLQFKLQMKVRNVSKKDAIPDTETIYWISPKRIEYYTNYNPNSDDHEFEARAAQRIAMQDFSGQIFDHQKDKGKVYDGDWDISDYRFEELEIYKALEARIKAGTPWRETDFYKTIVLRLNQGESLWGCDNEEAFIKRCDYLDRLIASIKEQGYKLNSEVLIEGDDPQLLAKHKEVGSEIVANIGRNGEYLFQDSRHRLAIAKILELDTIPVRVLVRHRQWQELRNHLSTMMENSIGASKKGLLYQSPIHPDLSDFASTHACENRFDAFKEHLEGHSGNLVDIGCNLGYFSHRCEDLGFNCYAIEYLPEVAWAANRIKEAENKKFQIIEGDFTAAFQAEPLKEMEFDTVIVLNILHHSLRTKEKYEAMKSWLQTLKVKRMIFEAHRTDEPHMIDAYANLETEDFIQFIFDNSSLTKSEFIYEAEDGRKMYKLT